MVGTLELTHRGRSASQKSQGKVRRRIHNGLFVSSDEEIITEPGRNIVTATFEKEEDISSSGGGGTFEGSFKNIDISIYQRSTGTV